MAKGIAFYQKPFFEIKTDKDLIYESMIRILMTAPTERVMRPGFGVGMNRQVFKLATPDFLQDLAVNIHTQLKTYEQRVTVVDVQTEFEDPDIVRIRIFSQKVEDPTQIESVTLTYTI
jgi:phage baseplate assembly protein W